MNDEDAAPQAPKAVVAGVLLAAVVVVALAIFALVACEDNDYFTTARTIKEIVCPAGQTEKRGPCCALLEDGARVLVPPGTEAGQRWGTGTACPEDAE